MKAAIIIPVFNEEKYLKQFIPKLIRHVKKLQDVKKIYFINDGSTDKTEDILNKYKTHFISVIRHSTNKGKGAALRTGFDQAKNKEFDAVIFMDGDCQHDPKYLTDYLDGLKKYPVIFGYRKFDKKAPLIRKVGNDLARFLFRHFFRIKRHDLLCGFTALRKDIFDKLDWKSNDYGVEVELSTIIGKKNIASKEILINTTYLDNTKGVNLLDAFFIFMKIPFWYIQY